MKSHLSRREFQERISLLPLDGFNTQRGISNAYQAIKNNLRNSPAISFKYVTINGLKTKIYRGYD